MGGCVCLSVQMTAQHVFATATLVTSSVTMLAAWSLAAFGDPGFLPTPKHVAEGATVSPGCHHLHVMYEMALTHPATPSAQPMCVPCELARPIRTKHCPVCRRCVVRFDHHCPWLGVCVGAGNYRAFMLCIACTAIMLLAYLFLVNACVCVACCVPGHA